MKLFCQKSQRVGSDNRPYRDLFLGWVYQGRPYVVRVKPQFVADYEKLFALAEEVPTGELIEKYL